MSVPYIEQEDSLEADLNTVSDDEYFEALDELPELIDSDTGQSVDAREGVVDER